MSKAMRTHNILMLIISIIFALGAAFSIGYGFYYCAHNQIWGDNILSLIYSVLHFIIAFTTVFFIIRMMKRKKSLIMRTLMYTADNHDIKSVFARNLCIVLLVTFFIVGTYSLILMILPNSALFGTAFPFVLKLDLVNASYYMVFMTAFFLPFPYLYEKEETPYD
ncbi:MAG: hypothetical protein K5694_00065 [Bacilli bacterium]|nr:hypothetical protein [Bacilli bacterium]